MWSIYCLRKSRSTDLSLLVGVLKKECTPPDNWAFCLSRHLKQNKSELMWLSYFTCRNRHRVLKTFAQRYAHPILWLTNLPARLHCKGCVLEGAIINDRSLQSAANYAWTFAKPGKGNTASASYTADIADQMPGIYILYDGRRSTILGQPLKQIFATMVRATTDQLECFMVFASQRLVNNV